MKGLVLGILTGIVLTTTIFISIAAFAQDGVAAFVRPLVVDVQQVVPIVADVILPLDNGTTVTATVPLTVNIALQVSLSGVVSNSVKIQEETEPTVEITEALPSEHQSTSVSQDEKLIYDKLSWTVDTAENMGQEYDNPDDFFKALSTKASFIVVNFTVENIGDTPKNAEFGQFNDYSIVLQDGKGRKFDPYDGIYESCRLVELNPGLSESCVIAFEVPKDAADLSIIFANEDGEQTVSLGF